MSEPSVSTSSPVSIWQCYLSTWLKHDIRFHHSAGDIIGRKADAMVPEFKPSDEISEVPFFIRYKFDFWITSWAWKSEGHQWKCKQYPNRQYVRFFLLYLNTILWLVLPANSLNSLEMISKEMPIIPSNRLNAEDLLISIVISVDENKTTRF